jgi:hypothetical protein
MDQLPPRGASWHASFKFEEWQVVCADSLSSHLSLSRSFDKNMIRIIVTHLSTEQILADESDHGIKEHTRYHPGWFRVVCSNGYVHVTEGRVVSSPSEETAPNSLEGVTMEISVQMDDNDKVYVNRANAIGAKLLENIVYTDDGRSDATTIVPYRGGEEEA